MKFPLRVVPKTSKAINDTPRPKRLSRLTKLMHVQFPVHVKDYVAKPLETGVQYINRNKREIYTTFILNTPLSLKNPNLQS